MLTSQEIRTTAFETVKKGYSVEDVDSFLKKVAGEYDAIQNESASMLQEKDRVIEELEGEKNDLEKKMLVIADKLEEYRSQETLLQNALLNAEKMKESLIGEAKQTSEILLRDAQQKADHILESANRQVVAEQQNYVRMQQEVAKFKDKILDIYKNHLAVISTLPDESDISADYSPAVLPDAPALQAEPAADVPAELPEVVPAVVEAAREDASEAEQRIFAEHEQGAVEAAGAYAAAEAESAPAQPAWNAEPERSKYDGFAPRASAPRADEKDDSPSRFGQLDFGDKFTFGK